MKEIRKYFEKKGDTIYLVKTEEAVEFLNNSIESDFVSSLHRISDKGLFASLIECCSKNRLGFDITGDAELEDVQFLNGETDYLAIVSVDEDQEDDFVDYMFSHNVELTLLGHVTRGELRMDDTSFGFINDRLK